MDSPSKSPSPLPASSPTSARGDGAPETILTPRSKIKALMAKIDDSSDDDESSIRHTYQPQKSSPLPETQNTSKSDEDASDGEDEDVPLPRGRLAARMRATEKTTDSPSDQDADIEGAYERLKRRLQARKTGNQVTSSEANVSENDHEPPAPGSMRRALFTKKKAGTPSSRPSTQDGNLETTSRPGSAVPSRNGSPAADTLPREEPLSKATTASDSDEPLPRNGNESFFALVAAKRAERKAREAKEEAERAKRRERMQQNSDKLDEILSEDVLADLDDADGGKRLASQAKPTRKASKKAIEAMNRETQRMSRNMQLAHAATTRKKITKESLFAKFNFRQPVVEAAAAQKTTSSSLPGSSRPASDAEHDHQTPPTSPATPVDTDASGAKLVDNTQLESLQQGATSNLNDSNVVWPQEEFSDPDEIFNAPESLSPIQGQEKETIAHLGEFDKLPVKMSAKAKGKQRADPLLPLETFQSPEPEKPKRTRIQNFRIKLPATREISLSDSDSELEIASQKPMAARFDAILAKAPRSRHETNQRSKFRALAHLTSPSKQDRRFAKKSVPAGQMQMDLQRKAREQITREREERLNELKARGVLIQTAEERERDQMMTEDLLEKARREVEELTKKEKGERKKDGEAGDAGDQVEIDESDDESYMASGSDEDQVADAEDENEVEDPEMSGSEEEEEEEGVELGQHGLVDNEAAEDDGEESIHEEQEDDQVAESDVDTLPQMATSRRSRVRRVLDEEDEDEEEEQALIKPSTVPATQGAPSPSPVVNPFAIAANPMPFGNAVNANPFTVAPMGLTQAFVGTIDNSQGEDDDDFTQNSSNVVAVMPEPDLPVHDQASIAREENRLRLESLETPAPSLPATQYNTQHTTLTQDFEMPEPTQDQGLFVPSPIAQRFASVPPSTVDTVVLSNPQAAEVVNPNLKKKGRLLRRSDMGRKSDNDGADDTRESAHVEASSNPPNEAQDAFAAMKKAEKRRQKLEEFNKKRSAAKEIIDEQAEESEDEYAGLGGASDDESGSEMDEEVKKMLDDETQLDLNESQLAAFHADKERVSDEKTIEKLYKDINSGALRRKRGTGGFDDLSDSDDEIERRRRMKRAEFARMRKALLADENVGKIAENPKKAAFLKALEDREDRDDLGFNFLDEPDVSSELVREDSIQEVPNSQPEAGIPAAGEQRTSEKRKRPLEETDPNARLPPALRRTNPYLSDGTKRPATLAEIRESVSFLVEDSRGSEIQVPATPSSDVEGSDADEPSESRFAARRAANPVVDRLSIKRQESANSNSGGGSRVAFFAKGRDEQGFRVPSLLKKATTLSASGDQVFVTERTAGGRKEGEVKRGGTKKSSVAYFAREVERRKNVDRIEKRRETERKKAVDTRRNVLRGLGGGKFE